MMHTPRLTNPELALNIENNNTLIDHKSTIEFFGHRP